MYREKKVVLTTLNSKYKKAGTQTKQHHNKSIVGIYRYAVSVTLQIWYLPLVLHQRVGYALSWTRNPETVYLSVSHIHRWEDGRLRLFRYELLREFYFLMALMLQRQSQSSPVFDREEVNADGMVTS